MEKNLRSAVTQPVPLSPFIKQETLKWWGFVAIISVAVFLVYFPAWNAGFVWDDDAHITTTAFRSWYGLWKIWFEVGSVQQYYPLVHTVSWLEYKLFADVPNGYHFVNIGLHALNAVLIALILKRLRIPGAYLASALFALHPVMVESVAWITEIKNTLSGAFYFGAVLAYLRFDESRRRSWYILALGFFVAALLSKTTAASLPGALLVIFWWKKGRLSWKDDVIPLIPFFVLGAVDGLFVAWVEWRFVGARGSDFAYTPIERGLIAGRVIWFYLAKLVWPAELIFIYPKWKISQDVAWQYLYPVAALIGLALLWKIRYRTRAPLAAALFFIGTLFPVLGFLNVYMFIFSYVADHLQYMASLGLIVFVAAGFEMAAQRWATRRTLISGGAVMLLIVLGALTWRQTRMYRDIETLYLTTLEKNPKCWMAYNNLGVVLLDKGRVAEAIANYEEALRLKPNHAKAHYNLGNALLQAGQPSTAIEHYEKALELQPDLDVVHSNLGNALIQAGRVADAIEHYREALRVTPAEVTAYNNLGNALLQIGKTTEAIECFQQAIKLQPESGPTHNNLGNGFLQVNQVADAVREYHEALRLQPLDALTHSNLGNALVKAGQGEEAILEFEEALKLRPGTVISLYNLANTLAQVGRLIDAIERYQEVIRLDPSNFEASNNLGVVYARLNRLTEARQAFEQALRINPNFASARNNLARIEAMAGRR